MCQTLYTALSSAFFKLDLLFSSFLNLFNNLDLPPPDYKKTDKKLINEFLLYDIYSYIDIKAFLLKQASFYKYT